MRVAFLPIDNRPVCYTLPKLIAQIDKGIEFFVPDRNLLGGLTKNADIEGLFDWICNLPELDAFILSLDTIAYGGLIPSRRCPETFEQIKQRVEKLKKILEKKKCKIYAFSSIMRISNNNFNVEEKEYWAKWGEKIFKYSYEGGVDSGDIPKSILDDYLQTRKRNFEINKLYLKWQKEGLFDTLIFSKDDCAQYGFNVEEAKALEELGGFTKTGADEIPLSLLSRAIEGEIKICPIFLEPDCKHLVSKYEDVSIENSVRGQIELAGGRVVEKQDADILLFVNNFRDTQGEIVMGVNTKSFDNNFVVPDRPYMVADVRFANGADNCFIEELFKNNLTDGNFYGYSAWNTSANTLGSLICGAKIKFLAKKYNKDVFKRLQVTRFLDDWAYQANVRQTLKTPEVGALISGMKGFENRIAEKLNTEVSVTYSYPWERLFEVEVEFN